MFAAAQKMAKAKISREPFVPQEYPDDPRPDDLLVCVPLICGTCGAVTDGTAARFDPLYCDPTHVTPNSPWHRVDGKWMHACRGYVGKLAEARRVTEIRGEEE